MELMNGISVIVCCYNSAWIIERCLKSFVGSTKTHSSVLWEIIVVNNASTDDTERIAK